MDLGVAHLPRRNHMPVPATKTSTINLLRFQNGPNLTQVHVRKQRLPISLRNGTSSSPVISFSIPSYSTLPPRRAFCLHWSARLPLRSPPPKCSGSLEPDSLSGYYSDPPQGSASGSGIAGGITSLIWTVHCMLNSSISALMKIVNRQTGILKILKESNSILPHVVLASTLLALIFPPSFTWFTSRYYAPALGFLMFAVGVNSSEKDFLEALNRPAAIVAGYVGQFVVKPFLGYLFGIMSVTVFGLPTAVGAGIMLVSCVSGAQLSNYATFLTDPQMAPLSIVMTSLSTASAVFVTPLLSLLLIGKRLPVDVKGMVSSIMQIVVAPIAAGLLLNRFFPHICNAIRPFLPPLSVLVTAVCVGAPLAINIESVKSPFGVTILLLVVAFHLSAFIAGHMFSGLLFRNAPDVKALQRTISFETGMQSSLLALALANRFFQDPIVGVPPAISTVIMSLMGFFLVMVWSKRKD